MTAPTELTGVQLLGTVCGLTRWSVEQPAGLEFWTAPHSTRAALSVDGTAVATETELTAAVVDPRPDLPAELLWSTRAAEVPLTRAVAVLTGAGPADLTEAFGLAHRIAELVAAQASVAGDEVGPIDVLVVRPDAPLSGPVATEPTSAAEAGAVFEFTHTGGHVVRLELSRPAGGSGEH